MRELEVLPLRDQEVDEGLAAKLEAARFECLELRFALSSLCEAIEGWGQWTMSADLAEATRHASTVLGSRRVRRAER